MTTTIQIHEDVKARLLEKRENETESFNDILRRLLNMNKPDKDKYKSLTAEILFSPFYPKDNELLIGEIGPIDDEDKHTVKINSVEVDVSIYPTLDIEIEAKTSEELNKKIEAVQEHLKDECLEIKTYGQVEISTYQERVN